MKMKRIFILLLFLFPISGCFSEIDSELSLLERRMDRLEQRCQEMNTTLQGIRKIVETLESYDFLTRIDTLRENGRITGYVLYFTHSSPVTLYNGTDAETPELGVAKGEDGVWYWTVKYPSDSAAKFITDNYGVRIPTSAASPEFKIENGYWMITYDGGEVWHNAGKATGEDAVSFFKSIEDMGTYYQFNLLNGNSFYLPTWDAFQKLQDLCRKTNDNLEAFQRLVSRFSESLRVSDIIPILNGEDTIGFTLILTDGSTYSFYDGVGYGVPSIGASTDPAHPEDETWYWTFQYGDDPAQWLLDDEGNKIRASAKEGLKPVLSLQHDGDDPAWYWAIAYGDGNPTFLLCNGKKVRADVDVPEAPVQSIVSVREDLVCITMTGGQQVYIPLARAITVTLLGVTNNTLTMGASETTAFSCHLSAPDEQAEVLPLANDGFYATASTSDHQNWTIYVKAPTDFTDPSTSKLNLLVSTGYGTMKSIIITILSKPAAE